MTSCVLLYSFSVRVFSAFMIICASVVVMVVPCPLNVVMVLLSGYVVSSDSMVS